MTTELKNKVISIFDRKTSMRLTTSEWEAFDDVCKHLHLKRKKVIEKLFKDKPENFGLTCAVRDFVVSYLHQFLH